MFLFKKINLKWQYGITIIGVLCQFLHSILFPCPNLRASHKLAAAVASAAWQRRIASVAMESTAPDSEAAPASPRLVPPQAALAEKLKSDWSWLQDSYAAAGASVNLRANVATHRG